MGAGHFVGSVKIAEVKTVEALETSAMRVDMRQMALRSRRMQRDSAADLLMLSDALRDERQQSKLLRRQVKQLQLAATATAAAAAPAPAPARATWKSQMD